VKDNQPHLLEDIQECLSKAFDSNFGPGSESALSG
jgi:hypothetical protein